MREGANECTGERLVPEMLWASGLSKDWEERKYGGVGVGYPLLSRAIMIENRGYMS